MIRRHRSIVMDNRGTGSSGAIACRNLQQGIGDFVDAVATCAAKLGAGANSYGTAAVADDLHAILRGLHVRTVDVYGDSYGSYAAQVFTIRYPSMVRAAVYDGAYNNNFSPFETEASAALRASWTRLCLRARHLRGILGGSARFARRLEAHPVVGSGHDADGNLVHVRLTAGEFARSRGGRDVQRHLLPGPPRRVACLRSRRPDAAPATRGRGRVVHGDGRQSRLLLRRATTWRCTATTSPAAWDPAANVATRRTQLAAAIARSPRDAFAPFSFPVWLNSLVRVPVGAGLSEMARAHHRRSAVPAAGHSVSARARVGTERRLRPGDARARRPPRGGIVPRTPPSCSSTTRGTSPRSTTTRTARRSSRAGS